MAVKKIKEMSGDLFIPMHDVSEKRKHLLLSLKNSLIMQEEYDKILMMRAKKAELLKTIKKGMTSLNTDYLKLKKHFPNVKNVLLNTEKEIGILESQISLLKNTNVKNDKDVLTMIEMEESINPKLKKANESKNSTPVPKKPAVKKVTKSVPKKPLTKKERVRANLKSIESKLNKL